MRTCQTGVMVVLAAWGATSARAADILAFDTGQRWQNRIILTLDEHDVTVASVEDIPTVDFAAFDIVYLSDNYLQRGTPAYARALDARAADLFDYVSGGGRLIVGVQAYGGSSKANGEEYGFLPQLIVKGLDAGERVFGDDVDHVRRNHPLFRPFPFPPGPGDLSLSNWGSSYHGALPAGGLPILAANFDPDPRPLIRGGRLGSGWLLVWTLDPDFHGTPPAVALVRSALDWVSCTEREVVSTQCKLDEGENTLSVKVKKGLAGARVIFRLDGGRPQTKNFNSEGKAKADWLSVSPGRHQIEVELSCGDIIRGELSCPDNRCTGAESLSANCRPRDGGNLFKATVKSGVPNAPVVFLLDGDRQISTTLDDRGQATAKWPDTPPGQHTATADLACGDRLRKRKTCP